jgi:hypothetical protein
VYAVYTPAEKGNSGTPWYQTVLFWIIIVGAILAIVFALAFVVRKRQSP